MTTGGESQAATIGVDGENVVTVVEYDIAINLCRRGQNNG